MRLTTLTTWLAATLLLLGLAACGGGDSGGPIVGDAAHGKKLYNQPTLGRRSAEGCVSCHKHQESDGPAEKAPYTAGTGTRAATRVPGMSAEEYIRESLFKPDAYVVEGYNAGDMYQKWAEDLSEQQVADLIAYLLSEK